jgi:putative SOS response-associated peptidase YedK
MCGRFSLGATIRVGQLFDLPDWPDIPPRYNIAPSQDVLTVIEDRETAVREARPMRWGLVPFWAKEPSAGIRTINARAETVADRPVFRRPFRERRCLIPADGFYEWQRQGARKQPYYVRLSSGEPFAFAGLWDRWTPAEGDSIETCTILTTSANEVVAPLHDRMPVIVPTAAYGLWLDRAMRDAERLRPLLTPYPAAEMTAYPVSLLVNNPRNDTPDCIAPVPRVDAP